MLKSFVSYDKDYDKAVEACRPFAGTLSSRVFRNEMIGPRELKEAGEKVDKKIIAEAMLATNEVDRIISAVEKFDRLGFDIVEAASLSPDQ